MAFTVKLFSFTKITNSTARPDLTAGTDFNCVLKKDCGIMSPRIELDIGASGDPSAYNYAYIGAFNRYYYISEWAWESRLWVAYLEEDTLATWKTYIGTETFYILRAAHGWNGNITDDMYPTFPVPTIARHEGSERPWLPDLNAGHYVVGVINNSGNAMGAVGYYVFTNAQFRTLCSRLMDNTSWLDVPTEISQGGIDDGLLKTLFNPFQYIVSCKWYPFNPPTGDSISDLPYGWWRLNNVSCSRLASQNYVKEIDFNLSKHPQASVRGEYLNCGPFTEMQLSMEPFGTLVIDPAYFTQDSKIVTLTSVDCISGAAILEICKPSTDTLQYPANVIQRSMANFGVDIQIAQIAVDKLNQAETVISGAADVTRDTLSTAAQATNVSNLLNPIAGALGTAASGAQTVSTATHAIADGIRASVPQMQTSGMNGSIAAFSCIPILQQSFYRLVNEDNENTGRPYCISVTPQTLGGYMVARNPDIKFPGTINEISAVKAYLEAGFYYE